MWNLNVCVCITKPRNAREQINGCQREAMEGRRNGGIVFYLFFYFKFYKEREGEITWVHLPLYGSKGDGKDI